MKKGHLTLLKGDKAGRTHLLDVQDNPKPFLKDRILDFKIPIFAIVPIVIVIVGAGLYIAITVAPDLAIALSVLVLFASLWYGQFWLAFLILLWWLWLS